MRRGTEQGQVTAFVVVLAAALVLLAGLVVDGGMVLAAKRRAQSEADAAARAGAQGVDLHRYYGGEGLLLDPVDAQARVRAYMDGTGHSATAEVDRGAVTVTVRFSYRPQLLGALGLGTVSVKGIGRARIVSALDPRAEA